MRRAAIVTFFLAGTAHAQQQKLWTTFDTSTSHTNVAAQACQTNLRATLQGRDRPIVIDAIEDNALLCSSNPQPDAVRVTVRMTNDVTKGPSRVIVELDAPSTDESRAVLLATSQELQRRATSVIVPQSNAPQGPMHEEKRPNWPLIATGLGLFGGGWLISAVIGATIAGSTRSDPGTSPAWFAAPFFGAVAFSATYKEAPNCNCEAGRAFSIVGSVVLDGMQVAGVVLLVAGIASPKTKMVPDSNVSLKLLPAGIALEGRF